MHIRKPRIRSLAEREGPAVPTRGLLIVAEPPLDELLGGGGDDTLDAVSGHEVQAPRAAAHDRLPHLDRPLSRPRNQRDLLQAIAAVRDIRRNRVVLALVRERLLPECFEDDLHLLLEELAVGLAVQHRVAEGLHLAGVIAAPDAEDDAAPGQDVRGGVVLGEPERMPGGDDVEGAADLHALGAMGEIDGQHRNVGDALVALVLEVVLGQPERLVPERVGGAGQRDGGVEDLDQPLVGIPAIVGRRARQPALLQLNVAHVERRESRDHRQPGAGAGGVRDQRPPAR